MSVHRLKTEFLNRFRVTDGGSYTHVLLTNPFGKYRIPEDDRAAIQELHQTIRRCAEKGIDFGLCECHDESIPEPFYFDLDFSVREGETVSLDHVRGFVRVCNTVFLEYLKSPNLTAYISAKPQTTPERKGAKWHVGFHVQYPELLSFSTERLAIYHQLLARLKTEGTFSTLALTDERVEEIVDSRVINKNAIIKYGCNKSDKDRYRVIEVLDADLKQVPFKDDIETLSETLSIRKALWMEEVQSTPFLSTEVLGDIRDEMVLYATPKRQPAPPPGPAAKDSPPRKRNLAVDVSERIKKLLGMLASHRSESYDSWIQVSLCLHNISQSEEMFGIWKDWSTSGCPEKAGRTDFRRLWQGFQYRHEGLKMGSLALWAKEDSPDEFVQYKMTEIENRIKRTIDDEKCTYDIAKVLKEMYDGVYVCSSIRNKTWYEFRRHSYVEIQEGYTLFVSISEQLVHEYEKRMAAVYMSISSLISSGQKDLATDAEKKINDIKDLIRKLKDATFKTKIMVEARNLFYDEEFENKLNEQRNLLVFRNGVYDLDLQEFRSGRPEDYMSFTTGINYREFDPHNEEVAKVEHIIRQIHPKHENYVFFMIILAAGLHGIKKEQKLDVWTGTGSNGKSIMIDFLAKALGDFYECPSITMLTRRRQSSSNASPDLAKLKGRRIVSFLEPEYDDTLHTSIIKQFFGNDWIEARPLYKEPIKFKSQASGYLSCNDLPKIPCNDGGTWRRLRVLEFKSKFVHNPVEPHEKKIDVRLPEQIEYLAESFMSLLIHYYKVFINDMKGVVTEPQDVREFTEKWQMESDVYMEFVKECVRDCEEAKAKISQSAAWEHFRFWCRSNAEWVRPKKHEFQKQMVLRLGEPKRCVGWVGKKLVTPRDEEEEGGGVSA